MNKNCNIETMDKTIIIAVKNTTKLDNDGRTSRVLSPTFPATARSAAFSFVLEPSLFKFPESRNLNKVI